MSEAKDAVLARLRQSIGRTDAEEERARQRVRERLVNPTPNLVPARGQLEPEARVQLFIEMARKVTAEVERVPDLEGVPAAAAAFLRRHNVPQKLVMAPVPVLDACRWESQPLLRVHRGTAEPSDAAGLTLAAAGIAETGTVMLVSSPELPTLLAFLPESSIVVLPAAWIDGAYEQSWQRLREVLGQPPRSVNLITGPSRTGDIAQKIELGAHGPRRLLVLIVDELPPELRAAG